MDNTIQKIWVMNLQAFTSLTIFFKIGVAIVGMNIYLTTNILLVTFLHATKESIRVAWTHKRLRFLHARM